MTHTEDKFCEYCCNFDKAHIGIDGMSICKITNMLTYCEANGSECPYFNTTSEKQEENLMRALNKCIDTENDNNCDNCPFDKFGADECIKKLLISARSHIAKLESKSRWISVEERLPETDIDVLICFKDGGSKVIGFINRFKKWKNSSTDYPINAEILAWMPLLEAPKEVSENV